MPKKKTGRPPGGEYAEKKAVMNFRVRPDTKRLLQQAAQASGRTLSQETEHQLRRALAHMGTGRTHALMNLIARSIDSIINLKDRNAHWMNDPYLFGQACDVVEAAFRLLRPQEPLPSDQDEFGGKGQGKFAINSTFYDLQLADPSAPLTKQTAYQREMAMLKRDLGAIADRPVIWGKTAEQHRLARDLSRELVPLMRKDASALTPAEWQRLGQGLSKIAEIGDQPASHGEPAQTPKGSKS